MVKKFRCELSLKLLIINVVLISEQFLLVRGNRLGCPFENGPPYYLKARANGAAVFGENLTAYQIPNESYFNDFKKKIKDVYEEFMETTRYSSVDNMIRFYHIFQYQKLYHGGNFSKIYKDFIPNYEDPDFSHGDPAGMSIMLLETLLENDQDLADHVALITCSLDVSSDLIEDLISQTLLPPPGFKHNHVAGIIKIFYNGTLGYVILDPTLGLRELVVVMSNQRNENQATRVTGNRLSVGTVENFSFYMHRSSNFLVSKSKSDLLGSVYQHLYYIGLPFCSFLETTIKSQYLNTFRSIVVRNMMGTPTARSDVQLRMFDDTPPHMDFIRKPDLADRNRYSISINLWELLNIENTSVATPIKANIKIVSRPLEIKNFMAMATNLLNIAYDREFIDGLIYEAGAQGASSSRG